MSILAIAPRVGGERQLAPDDSLLLVDNRPALMLEQMTRALANSGIPILYATDFERGVELAASRHPSVIVCDFDHDDLPRDYLHRLIEMDPLRPIIVIDSREGDTPDPLPAGAFARLKKPVTIADIQDVISRARAVSQMLRRRTA